MEEKPPRGRGRAQPQDLSGGRSGQIRRTAAAHPKCSSTSKANASAWCRWCVALAILFAVGLVGFGIGGGASGGLFDAINGNGGGGSSGSSTFKKEVSKLQARVRLSPKDKQAWDKLALAEYNLARSSGDYDANTGQFSAGAETLLPRPPPRGSGTWR